MKLPEKDIPLLDLQSGIEEYWDELQAAIARVLRSGRFILGPEVEAFESEVAEYLGVKHAIGVNSGTDALVIALRALGIGHGDEVITTPFTFVATAEAICNVGATPVFVDIDPATFNIDPARIGPAITKRTKAILPVHLFGLACDMTAICETADRYKLKIVEDTAQAFGGSHQGRKLGTIGNAGAFSFFPSKNLGAFGDGGLIATDDPRVAEEARKLRSHGGKNKYLAEKIGYNSRLDEIQAAVLRVKLPQIDQWNRARVQVADEYFAQLSHLNSLLCLPQQKPHVYHQFTVRIPGDRREEVRQELLNGGIQSAIYYPVPLHLLSSFSPVQGPLDHSELASREVLSLPIGPSMLQEQVEFIAKTVHRFLSMQQA